MTVNRLNIPDLGHKALNRSVHIATLSGSYGEVLRSRYVHLDTLYDRRSHTHPYMNASLYGSNFSGARQDLEALQQEYERHYAIYGIIPEEE